MINWSPEHQYLSAKTADVLLPYIQKNGIDVCFTHDWIFTGWNLPYAGAIRFVSFLEPRVGWLHWVHSVPSAFRDWWNLSAYGPQHKIIFPNVTDRRRVAEQFRTNENNIFIIPHIKDMRIWYDMSEDTNEIIDKIPHLMQAEMVQVYPASSDRLSAKGLENIITIFSCWKKRFVSCCLLIANQWATGRQRMEDLERYEKLAQDAGLEVGKEFMFTSRIFDKYKTGIPSRVLRELQSLSNVFIFPTREESFGLVGPEACFAGVIPVFNKSLGMMSEVYGNSGLYFDFGSFHSCFQPNPGWNEYLKAVAMVIYGAYQNNETIKAKTYCRRSYNMDALYNRYYLPALETIRQIASGCERSSDQAEEVLGMMKKLKTQFENNEQEKKGDF
jgi:glycosyltransferase involved in cell wall biosynthesis